MESQEQLQEKLKKARQKSWVDSKSKKVGGRSAKRRDVVRTLLRSQPNTYIHGEELQNKLDQAIAFFEELGDKKRGELWKQLFPKLGPHLERAWQEAPRRPFQLGHGRAPFRAPGRSDVVATNRAWFFHKATARLQGLDEDAAWLAAWAPHFPPDWDDNHTIPWILSTVLRAGGPDAEAVRQVLVDSINAEHEIGRMGDHAVVALLNSDRREDWEVIGKLLLAAQRQEGLRQSILEAVDEANPDAFCFMLDLILEHDLGRFSATVRAFDVWLGMQWAGGSAKVVHEGLAKIREALVDEEARARAIDGENAEDAYLALWVTAFLDGERVLASAGGLLESGDPEKRFAALRIIERLNLHPDCLELIAKHFLSGREDDDRIRMAIMEFFSRVQFESVSDALFEATGELFNRLPARKKKLEPILWPWAMYTLDRRAVAGALRAMAAGAPDKLLPYAQALDSYECIGVIQELAGIGMYWENGQKRRKRRKLSVEARQLIVQLTCDSRQDVQRVSFEALEPLAVEEDEVDLLLSNLHRSAAVLRAGAIGRFAKLNDARVLEIIGRLLSDKDAKKQAAGVELAAHLAEHDRSTDAIQALVQEHSDALIDPELQEATRRINACDSETVSLDDALGLVPEGSRRSLIKPQFKGVTITTDAAKACARSLAELFLAHGETEITVRHGEETTGRKEHLNSYFPNCPRAHRNDKERRTDEQMLEQMPLREVWEAWIAERPKALRDKDGLELVRMWAIINDWTDNWRGPLPKEFKPNNAWSLQYAFRHLVGWMPLLEPQPGGLELLVQASEDLLAKFDPKKVKKQLRQTWRGGDCDQARSLRIVNEYKTNYARSADASLRARLGALEMFGMETGVPGCAHGPEIREFGFAYDEGLVNEADFTWLLLRDRREGEDEGHYYSWRGMFGPIDEATRLRPSEALSGRPKLLEAAHRVRDRLIEIELTRGERATPASMPASAIRSAGGAEVLFRLAGALGRDKIVRQDQWGEPTRSYSFSRLISVTAPTEQDTPERFAELFERSGLKPLRLLELGMFAPQWAGHVEKTLEQTGLEDAIWWIHAHTKKGDYWRDQEIRDMWAGRIAERTELEAEDLEEGAVDVAWFGRVVSTLGEAGWDALQKPAKYASNSGSHKRAELFSGAMLGRVTTDELRPRIDDKRHQDAIRALGLVPLPGGETKAQRETLARYTRMQEFKRESRKFGSQRQASEGRAVEIGMQNLARTAGYRDPRRLQWAMEAEAVADLADGPVTVTAEETSVSIAIDESGGPELTILKKGKALKNVPAKLRKHEQISELRARVTDLRKQRSRMRLSLEESMCRGDEFTPSKIGEFIQHPMLRPMVERLVFVGASELIGYPDEGGKVLRDHTRRQEPMGKRDVVRLAHPIDLLERGDWADWQRECFQAERVQPFKQIFREVYPKTKTELAEGDSTLRYAGHQVNPRQALALLKQRQWVHSPEEGVRKVHHDERLIGELWFQEHFYTPADVEGLTLESVVFRKRGEDFKHLPIAEVPDRLFSEAMRDLDLVVSVAHAGGVDPEASASTIEMRSQLLKETCQLLGLSNVRLEGQHAIIDGTHASYSVHLGSAGTKVVPGKALFIVAVHSQYRGRLFLPFVDDDPKTAEVMSKALLLARDHEIKDPSILDQFST